MTPRRQELPIELDLPVVDRAQAEEIGLELADQLRERVARERKTVRALREYLEDHAAG